MLTAGRLRYIEALPSASSSSSRDLRTLVLIHAFPLNANMWAAQLDLARSGWRVIAPHLRGLGPVASPAGASPAAAPDTTSVDDYAGDVIDLLDALHIERAVIGGLSLGGYVTLAMFRYAARYFAGMILADTRSQADTPEAVEGRKRTLTFLEDKGKAALVEDMIPKLLGETTRRDRPAVAERLRALVAENDAQGIAGAVRALMTRPDSTPFLGTIHCPTLVVVGDEDVLTPPAMSRALHEGIAGSQLVVLPGAGHLSSLETPRAFNAALEDFLTHRV